MRSVDATHGEEYADAAIRLTRAPRRRRPALTTPLVAILETEWSERVNGLGGADQVAHNLWRADADAPTRHAPLPTRHALLRGTHFYSPSMFTRRIVATVRRREIAHFSARRVCACPLSSSCRKVRRSFGSNSSSSEDPDEFRGPGGLTARQIFQKVQDSADQDAKYAKNIIDELEEEYSARVKRPNPTDMSVKELKQVLEDNSVDHNDYFEKSDLVQLVKDITDRK